MNNIKVMFIVPDFYPNSTGFANATKNMVNSIVKYGHDKYQVYVYTNVALGHNVEMEGVTIIRDTKKYAVENRLTYEICDRFRYNRLKGIILNNKIDVIFFETNIFPNIQLWALKDFGDKVYVRIHSTADTEVPVFIKPRSFVGRRRRSKIFEFMQNVHNITSTSTFYLNFVRKFFMHDNVYTKWNGKTYGLLFNTAGIDNEPMKTVNNNKFLTMGKMSDNGLTQKGLLDLVKAVYCLKKSRRLPNDFNLTIIGDGVKIPVVRKLISDLHLATYITIVEKATHEEVFNYVRSVRAIVLLSRYEGQSMFITESIALGKPLILSDNNGMQDMICDKINGYVVKTGDYYDAAEKLYKMMNLTESELEKMSKESNCIYNNNYTGLAVYQQFDELISFKI